MILSDTPQAPGPSASRLRLTDARNRAFIAANTGPANAALPTLCGSKPWFMAEAIVSWVREEAAPRALELGSPLRSVSNLASWKCTILGSPLPRRSDWAYCFGHFAQPCQPSPIWRSGRPAHRSGMLSRIREEQSVASVPGTAREPRESRDSFTDLEGRRREKNG
jgi:hypothetical protein